MNVSNEDRLDKIERDIRKLLYPHKFTNPVDSAEKTEEENNDSITIEGTTGRRTKEIKLLKGDKIRFLSSDNSIIIESKTSNDGERYLDFTVRVP